MLHKDDLVEDFLSRTLEYPSIDKKVISQIVEAERWLVENVPKPLDHSEDRWNLRRRILDELFNQKRVDNDDDIKLGNGGSLPSKDTKSEGKIFILIGPPAAGKSTIAAEIAEKHGAVIVDSDYAKRKLPEFEQGPAGASVVHEESDGILTGFKGFENEPNLLQLCIENNFNIVLPKIGSSCDSLMKIAEAFKIGLKYEVHLLLVYVSKKESTKRAVKRFLSTNRYVPLGVIFDHYGNDPIITYFKIKDKNSGFFTSMGAICTLDKRECVDAIGQSYALEFGEKTLNWTL